MSSTKPRPSLTPSSTAHFPGSFAPDLRFRTKNDPQLGTGSPGMPTAYAAASEHQNQNEMIRNGQPVVAAAKEYSAGPCAQFLGSFAADLRGDNTIKPKGQSWRFLLHAYLTDGWDDISLWKSAFIEFVGSTALIYLSAMIHTTIINSGTMMPAAFVAVSNIFLLSLFIYGLAPASGGHINPMITFTTITTGLTGFSRGVLYMFAQTCGATLAGGLIRGSFGRRLTVEYGGGGCLFQPRLMTAGQVYLIESVLSFVQLFLSFGVGLDPRQHAVFGPKLGPFLVSCSLALVSFSSVGLGDGYGGAGLNPARCFAFAVARGSFQYQWIWWFGPVTGGLVQSAVYHLAPPYHRQLREEAVKTHTSHLQQQQQGMNSANKQGANEKMGDGGIA